MANFGDLLGTLLQSGMAQSGQGRMGHALQDLQANLSQMTGGQAGDVLGSLVGAAKDALGNASQNPLQAGGLGAVLGSVLGGGGDSVKGAMAGGALAMLAGVALKALSQAQQSGAAAGSGSQVALDALLPGLKAPATAAEQQATDAKTLLILKAMVNSAKADGQVSPDEIQRIVGKAESDGIGAEEQAWLLEQLRAPLDLEAFVAEIPNQAVAAEVYAASLLAIEVDTPEERDYLQRLAAKTGLHPVVVQHIHQTLGVAL